MWKYKPSWIGTLSGIVYYIIYNEKTKEVLSGEAQGIKEAIRICKELNCSEKAT